MTDPIAHYDNILNTALRTWVDDTYMEEAVPEIRKALFAAGCGPFNNAYAAATCTPYELAAVEAARQREIEGELEIDDLPLVSHMKHNGGAYVQCWIWIDDCEIDDELVEEGHDA
jgi:hypothetical protein